MSAEQPAAQPTAALPQPAIVGDGFEVNARFLIAGFAPVEVVYRPITRRMWREFRATVAALPEAEARDKRDEFVISRIARWSLALPITRETFDNLYPDAMAEAILNELYGGTISDLTVARTGPADVETALGN